MKLTSIIALLRLKIRRLPFPKARRLVVAVIGFTVVFLGILMLVFPGPAIVVIPLGLAILASEFIWARRLLRRAKHIINRYTYSDKSK
ncbi:MAG: PGPGW domain-containing protein [Verrucomicrobia bacterium]|nr:PGPGW domain-containing protein [Verrucomicrobiota bacterium]MCF7708248.1 PGPGW domain-containing protein [Verrucomicrobiota bacterium]